jgi:hypothetical protein
MDVMICVWVRFLVARSVKPVYTYIKSLFVNRANERLSQTDGIQILQQITAYGPPAPLRSGTS